MVRQIDTDVHTTIRYFMKRQTRHDDGQIGKLAFPIVEDADKLFIRQNTNIYRQIDVQIYKYAYK